MKLPQSMNKQCAMKSLIMCPEFGQEYSRNDSVTPQTLNIAPKFPIRANFSFSQLPMSFMDNEAS